VDTVADEVKELRLLFRGAGSIFITEIDPICALQAAMDGFEVKN
jgi:S-adenosylhomocysteine hydrolase